MSQGGHPEDLPVARLKIYRFSGRDAVTYPLYKGINKAGRDPRKVRVYLPWDNCLDTHAAIECDEDGTAAVMVYEGGAPSTIWGKKSMIPGQWYHISNGETVKFSSLITCELQELTETERQQGPPRKEIPADILEARRAREKHKGKATSPSRTGTMAAPPVPIRSRAHGSAESNVPSVVKQDHRGHQNAADEAQVQQVPVQHRPEDHDVGDDTNTEEAATLPMAGVTQTMDDLLWLDENEYKDVVKGAEEGSAIRSTRPDDSGRLLPKELIERRNTTTSGTPGFSGSNPSSSSGNSQQDLSASENYSISHDGQYALTQPYPDTGGKSQFEGSQDDPNDSVQETQSPQQVVASLEAPIENALETEPINVSSSQQDRICETQPTLSRQASAEPTSQEVSQDFFAVLSEQILHPQERVSATPVELIINTSSTRHVSSETQGFVSDDGDLRKLRKRMHELEGRVPQTQEEKGHIGVSNVSIASTVLAPGPTADSLEGSLDSHPGHTSGNNEDPAFRELAASNKKGGFLAESEDELDRGSDNAVEERSFVVRTATPLRDDNDCSTEEYSELEDDELLSRSHRRPSRPILKDSQELLDVSPQVDDTPILGTGMYSGANALETPQSGTRPSSQTSTRSKEGSPKHGIESDTEGSPPKPAKLMKTESVDDSTFPSPFTRTPSSRSLSRRASDLESVRSGIMLSASSYSDKKKKRYENIISRWGGSLKNNNIEEAAILVFDGSTRTTKLMFAVAQGIPIVSFKWLDDSDSLGRFVPWEDYICQNTQVEVKYKFNLSESCRLAKDNKGQLFKGYSFYMVPYKHDLYTTKSVRSLVTASGGKMVIKAPRSDKSEDEDLIILGDNNSAKIEHYLERGFKDVMNHEFVMDSIIHQTLDWSKHRISSSNRSAPVLVDVSDEGSAGSEEIEGFTESDEEDNDDKNDEDWDASFSKSSSKGKAVARTPKTPQRARSASTISATESTASRRGSVESITVATTSVSGTSKTLSGSQRVRRTRTQTRVNETDSESEAAVASTAPIRGAKKTGQAAKKKEAKEQGTKKTKAKTVARSKKTKSASTSGAAKASATDTNESDVPPMPKASGSSTAMEASTTRPAKTGVKRTDATTQQKSTRGRSRGKK